MMDGLPEEMVTYLYGFPQIFVALSYMDHAYWIHAFRPVWILQSIEVINGLLVFPPILILSSVTNSLFIIIVALKWCYLLHSFFRYFVFIHVHLSLCHHTYRLWPIPKNVNLIFFTSLYLFYSFNLSSKAYKSFRAFPVQVVSRAWSWYK